MYLWVVEINCIVTGALYARVIIIRMLKLGCHSLTREPEMQEWVNHPDTEEKKRMRLSEDMRIAIDRFYFNHYCNVFRSGAFARANCSMYALPLFRPRSSTYKISRPMANMADDHGAYHLSSL